MFQIVSTLMDEVPAFTLRMRELRGEQPRVQLMDNPWGHSEDCVAKCDCQDPDRTGAYVHCLIPRTGLADSTLRDNADVSVDIATGFTFNDDCGYLGVGRAGSIPFVSEKPGAYGRLLLAVYVRWRTGLLISSDWLRPVTRGAWRAVLPNRVEEPNPVHGPSELTRHHKRLYKGAHTDRWTIVSGKATSLYSAIWTVLWIFRVDWCAFLFEYVRDLDWNYFVCVDVYRKGNGMDAPGFASPIRAYRQNLCQMRKSNYPNGSETTNLCSLGVVDLDLTVCPDGFGLRAFDEKMPVTRMLPGASPCDLRLLIPDAGIGQDSFLRRRWPQAVFQVMRERCVEMEDLRRTAYAGDQPAYRYTGRGYCLGVGNKN